MDDCGGAFTMGAICGTLFQVNSFPVESSSSLQFFLFMQKDRTEQLSLYNFLNEMKTSLPYIIKNKYSIN